MTRAEKAEVVSACPHLEKLKRTRSMPRAFTEHGAIMAATVLSSDRAIEMSIFIVRAFAKLRKAVQDCSEISRKLDTLERQVSKHDKEIVTLVRVIKRMLSPKPVAKKRRIGFKVSR